MCISASDIARLEFASLSIFAEKNVGVASPPLFLSVNMLGGQRLKLAPIFDRYTIVLRKRHKEELLKERKPVEIIRRAGPPRERGGKSDKKADMAFK